MKKRILSLCLVGILSFIPVGCAQNKAKETKGTKPVEIYLTRHGKTMLNTTDRMQGWCDAPLTEAGIEVAEYLGKGLDAEGIKFDAAYSSDSGRAIETANIVLDKSGQPDLKVNQSKDLREVSFGIYEGEKTETAWAEVAKANNMTFEEFMDTFDMPRNLDMNAKMPENDMAESSEELANRVKPAMDKIAKETEDNGGGKVLIVSHGITIMSFLEQIAPGSTEELISGLKNASVCKVVYQDGKYTVESVNDMSYVEKGKSEK
ncbi:histidine phosphatase family protein [Clostridium sp. MB05]|jgi:broad specificity phosphatase PhoE